MHKTVNPRTNVSVRKIRLSQKFNENRKFKRAQCIISRMKGEDLKRWKERERKVDGRLK